MAVVPAAEVAVQPVVDHRAKLLQRVKDWPGRVILLQLSATRALYLGPEGSGGDLLGCSDTAGTDRLGGLQGGDMHQRTDSAIEPPDDVPWTTPTTWCRDPSRTDQPWASGDRQPGCCIARQER